MTNTLLNKSYTIKYTVLVPNVMAARWIDTTVLFSPFVNQSTPCECEVYDYGEVSPNSIAKFVCAYQLTSRTKFTSIQFSSTFFAD